MKTQKFWKSIRMTTDGSLPDYTTTLGDLEDFRGAKSQTGRDPDDRKMMGATILIGRVNWEKDESGSPRGFNDRRRIPINSQGI